MAPQKTGYKPVQPRGRRTTATAATAAPPALPAISVSRNHLLSMLDLLVDQRLTVVVAPPGYGKTVLLSQWAARRRRHRVRWLTLSADHNDASRFARDVRRALSPGADRPNRARMGRDREVHPDAMTALFSQLEDTPPTTLVLDDFHVLTNRALIDGIAALMEFGPRPIHFVVATRVDPPPMYYRLRLSDVLVELRQDDLAFTRDEATELVRRVAGHHVADSHIEALVARTEGWAVGLQLAAISLRGQPDDRDVVEALASENRNVAEYLTGRVLRHQPAATRRFLLATSVLDRMSGPVCDFVIGHPGGQAMLEELERTSMFITRVEDPRGWFRYHQLFRALLRHRLRDGDPVRERLFLHRAAEWHVARDDLDSGVRYLADAGDWDAVMETAFRYGAALVSTGRSGAVAQWIEQVPRQARQGRADVLLLEVCGRILGGESTGVGEKLALIEQGESASAAERVVAGLLRAYWALQRGAAEEAIAVANRVLHEVDRVDDELIPNVMGIVRSRADIAAAAWLARGIGLVQQYELAEARRILQPVPEDLHPIWQVAAIGSLALVEAWSGRLRIAEQLGARAIALAHELGGDPSALTTGRLALAHVARELDQLERAREIVDELAGQPNSARDGVLASLVATENAHLAIAAGEAAVGLSCLVRHPNKFPLPRAVASRRQAVEAQLLIMIGDLDGASRALDLAPARDCSDVLSARARLAIERGDLAAARAVIAGWSDDSPRAQRERLVWLAVLDHLEGDDVAACSRLAMAVADAEVEGDIGIFRLAGPHVLGPARLLYRTVPSAFLRAIVELHHSPRVVTPVRDLVEQMTEREHVVLALLPTRLSNEEIATRLGVSVNTVKTHLKHIYRKLGVAGRREAVDAASDLRLV
jgi:LuxR family maltose regulon positive regulatory protein